MGNVSTFGKILKLLDMKLIKKAVADHESDKYSKGFGTLEQLVSLLFVQFSKSRSLRDLEIKFNVKKQRLYHINMPQIRRSTLSEANQKRKNEVFRDIADGMIKTQGQEVNEVVSLIDSSTIRVAGRGSEWTEATQTSRGKGLKLHIQCGGKDFGIESASITATNVNDITQAQKFELKEGNVYVFDKGYMNFNWWNKIDMTGAYFVTRIKKNTAYQILENRSIAACSSKIIRDCIVKLTNTHPRGGCRNLLAGKPLRLVTIYDKEHDKQYTFISNLHEAKADDIANYYKQRWGIELLFKWLKQNLKITKFLSENENAIKTQIYVAIIAYILIGMFKKLVGNSFTRTIDLMSWISITLLSPYRNLIPPNNHATTKKTKINYTKLNIGGL